jgi:hypothetical protein
LVETFQQTPADTATTRVLLRNASIDASDEAVDTMTLELTSSADGTSAHPDTLQHVAKRVSAQLLGVSMDDIEELEQTSRKTGRSQQVTRQESESSLFHHLNLDGERQSPVSRAQRDSGPLAQTTDELASLGLGAKVQGRELHACSCVLVGTAVLNTRAERGTIAAGLMAVNTGRVEKNGDVDVIRYQGQAAIVALYPGALLVRAVHPAAAALPTGNAAAPRETDLAVSYGKLTYWGRVFGNKKLVVLVAKGHDHKFFAIYLRFVKKAGSFLSRLLHEWGTLPASYAFQALPPPTMAESVMTFEARLLGVAVRRQADDPSSVAGAAGEVAVRGVWHSLALFVIACHCGSCFDRRLCPCPVQRCGRLMPPIWLRKNERFRTRGEESRVVLPPPFGIDVL